MLPTFRFPLTGSFSRSTLRRRAIALSAGVMIAAAGGTATASAYSPVPLGGAAPPDPTLSCSQHIPDEPGFDMHFSGIQTPHGVQDSGGPDVQAPESLCHYYGVSGGEDDGNNKGTFPAGVPHVANRGIDWAEACTLTTQSSSGPSTPAQAGDGSVWCVPAGG